jgi:putative glutathione S-transferase
MLNSEFDAIAAHPEVELYPEGARASIDERIKMISEGLTSQLYKCGSATSQDVYDQAFDRAFKTLDALEEILASSRYICGRDLTLADLRLFSTLIRFDAVYVCHFKANLRMLKEYRHLSGYTRELFQMTAIGETVAFDHIKPFYFSNTKINASGLIPKGPDLSYLREPHGRERVAN